MILLHKKSGFTLIELLVVISIISLLSSVVLTGLSSARAKARDSKRIQNAVQFRSAAEIFRSGNSDYPTGLADNCNSSNLNTFITTNLNGILPPSYPPAPSGSPCMGYMYHPATIFGNGITCGSSSAATPPPNYIIYFSLEGNGNSLGKMFFYDNTANGGAISYYCLAG